MILSMSKFIVIEGSEGVGKSSQIQTIQTYLHERKINYVLTREPGGTELGESIRSIILDEKNNTDDIFGPKHGVINWVCTAYKLNTKLEPVVDRDDTVERMVYRSRENVGNDRKDGR